MRLDPQPTRKDHGGRGEDLDNVDVDIGPKTIKLLTSLGRSAFCSPSGIGVGRGEFLTSVR
jgi:hypothetical protein